MIVHLLQEDGFFHYLPRRGVRAIAELARSHLGDLD